MQAQLTSVSEWTNGLQVLAEPCLVGGSLFDLNWLAPALLLGRHPVLQTGLSCLSNASLTTLAPTPGHCTERRTFLLVVHQMLDNLQAGNRHT